MVWAKKALQKMVRVRHSSSATKLQYIEIWETDLVSMTSWADGEQIDWKRFDVCDTFAVAITSLCVKASIDCIAYIWGDNEISVYEVVWVIAIYGKG
jgi:hypothetical protein